jgi:hypothetical protein
LPGPGRPVNIVLRYRHHWGVQVKHTQLIGAAVVLGGVAILGYNATILWHAAFELNARFPELAGWAAVGVMAVECLGLAVAGHLWAERQRGLAVCALLFTIAAALYTFRLEMNFQIAGQADQIEQRSANLSDNQLVQQELSKQREIRDRLQGQKKLSLRDAATLDYARDQIKELEKRWLTRIVTSDASPEAAWLSRQLGGEERRWNDGLQALPLIFWGLARMLVLPLGLALLATGARGASSPAPSRTGSDDDGEGEIKGASALVIEPSSPDPGEAASPQQGVAVILPDEKVGQPAAGVPVIYTGKQRLGTKVHRKGSVAVFAREMVRAADGGQLRSRAAYDAYKAWCARRGETAEELPQFSGQLRKATGAEGTRGHRSGVYYEGFQLIEERERAA